MPRIACDEVCTAELLGSPIDRENILTTRDTANAVLEDLDGELVRMSGSGATQLSRLAAFANVADALQFMIVPMDRPWFLDSLQILVDRHHLPVSTLDDMRAAH